MRLDARIPVRLVSSSARPAPLANAVLVQLVDVLPLIEEPDFRSGWAACRTLVATSVLAEHQSGCACCTGRSPLALIFGNLFAERAKAEISLFDHVVISVPDQLGAVAHRILCNDPLVAGRFRLVG